MKRLSVAHRCPGLVEIYDNRMVKVTESVCKVYSDNSYIVDDMVYVDVFLIKYSGTWTLNDLSNWCFRLKTWPKAGIFKRSGINTRDVKDCGAVVNFDASSNTRTYYGYDAIDQFNIDSEGNNEKAIFTRCGSSIGGYSGGSVTAIHIRTVLHANWNYFGYWDGELYDCKIAFGNDGIGVDCIITDQDGKVFAGGDELVQTYVKENGFEACKKMYPTGTYYFEPQESIDPEDYGLTIYIVDNDGNDMTAATATWDAAHERYVLEIDWDEILSEWYGNEYLDPTQIDITAG